MSCRSDKQSGLLTKLRDTVMLSVLTTLLSFATTLSEAELVGLSAEQLEHETLKGLMEKRTMINLLEAFAVSTKHYLRGESGVFYEDLYHLVAPLPKYAFPSTDSDPDQAAVLTLWRHTGTNGKTFVPANKAERISGEQRRRSTASSSGEKDVEKALHLEPTTLNLSPASNPPINTLYHYCPPLLVFRPIIQLFTRRGDTSGQMQDTKMREQELNANVPLQTTLFLCGYVQKLIARGTLPQPMYGVLLAPVLGLQDCIAVLERVLTTPLPFAYKAHLKFSVYICESSVPAIQQTLGYLSIVGVAVAATTFLGFMELGQQLEQPFGYDDSDLDLDRFCELLGGELQEIVAHPTCSLEFVFSEDNQPFGPDDTRTAPEILAENTGVRGFHRQLAKHFREQGTKEKSKREMNKPKRSITVFNIDTLCSEPEEMGGESRRGSDSMV
ncbi:hypothetical protein RQP46_011474 [Phenoliferia psychrophenolica]